MNYDTFRQSFYEDIFKIETKRISTALRIQINFSW